MANEIVCPFCGEPVTRERYLGRHQQFCCKYRCGTEGPDINGEYETGRVCDMHTYQRLLKTKDDEIKRLRNLLKQIEIEVENDNEPYTWL